jgi:hypothetical protein
LIVEFVWATVSLAIAIDDVRFERFHDAFATIVLVWRSENEIEGEAILSVDQSLVVLVTVPYVWEIDYDDLCVDEPDCDEETWLVEKEKMDEETWLVEKETMDEETWLVEKEKMDEEISLVEKETMDEEISLGEKETMDEEISLVEKEKVDDVLSEHDD